MGCDIHIYAEKQNEEGKWEFVSGVSPFDWRSYGMFGFLADVRNYSAIPPISARKGFPKDASDEVHGKYESWGCDAHSASWLSVKELSEFNYDALTEDRRVTRRVPGGWLDGGCTCDSGEGEQTTYREFLGEYFFKDLEKLQSLGIGRVVFWFDN